MRVRLLLTVGVAAAILAVPASSAAGTRSQTATLVSQNEVAVLTPTCPKGQRATGGGFLGPAVESVEGVLFFESRKVGQRTWRVSARKSGLSPRLATAFAYCSKDGPKTKEAASTISRPAGPGHFPADANCASGKARAGGFVSSAGLAIESFLLSKSTWRATTIGPPNPHTLTTYVYCARGDAPKARVASSSGAGSGASMTVTSATCKRGTSVASGGYRQPALPTGGALTPFQSYRTGKSWTFSGTGFGAAGTVSSIAYCV